MALEVSNPNIGVTGPVEHYVGIPAYVDASGAVVAAKRWYLGTCETQPQISLQRITGDVFNDLAGRGVPIQKIHQGWIGQVGVALTRYSRLAVAALKSFAANSNGTESRLSRGSLVFGNQSVQVYQQYSFYGTANAPPDLPPGRAWTNAILAKEDMLDSGTAVQKPLLVFECYPLFNPVTRGFVTWAELPADFAADLIPQ